MNQIKSILTVTVIFLSLSFNSLAAIDAGLSKKIEDAVRLKVSGNLISIVVEETDSFCGGDEKSLSATVYLSKPAKELDPKNEDVRIVTIQEEITAFAASVNEVQELPIHEIPLMQKGACSE